MTPSPPLPPSSTPKQTMSYMTLFEGQTPYLNFVNTIKSVRSIKTYSRCLEGYIKYRQLDNNKRGRFEDLLAENPRSIEASVMTYLVNLKKERDLSYATRNTILASIKHFYRMNDVETINWFKVAKVLGEYNRRVLNKRPYSREEIQKMLAAADQRMRVVILLLASTGMKVGALSDLILRNVQRIVAAEEYSSYKITVYEGTQEEHYTFCTPECAREIDQYLEYRTRCGEKLNPSSPLIRKEFNKEDSQKIRNVQKMTTDTIGFLIMQCLYSSGIQHGEHNTENSIKG